MEKADLTLSKKAYKCSRHGAVKGVLEIYPGEDNKIYCLLCLNEFIEKNICRRVAY